MDHQRLGAFYLRGDDQEVLSTLSLHWRGQSLFRSTESLAWPVGVIHHMGNINFGFRPQTVAAEDLHVRIAAIGMRFQMFNVGESGKELALLGFNWEMGDQMEFIGAAILDNIHQSHIVGSFLMNLERTYMTDNKLLGVMLVGWKGYNPRGGSESQKLLDLLWRPFDDIELNNNQNHRLGGFEFSFQPFHPRASNVSSFAVITMLHHVMPEANFYWDFDSNPSASLGPIMNLESYFGGNLGAQPPFDQDQDDPTAAGDDGQMQDMGPNGAVALLTDY